MQLLTYIFYLGVIYITFNLLWWLLMQLVKAISSEPDQQPPAVSLVLELVSNYFLVALTVLKSSEMIAEKGGQLALWAYPVIGGLVLFSYLARKRDKSPFQIMLNQQRVNLGPKRHYVPNKWVLPGTMVFYTLSYFYLPLVSSAFNLGLMQTISSIYNMVIIGWIIRILGFFFLLRILFQGLFFILNLGRPKAPQTPPPYPPPPPSQGRTEDIEEADYEILEDEEEPPTPLNP